MKIEDELNLQELYQTRCEEIDVIFGAQPKEKPTSPVEEPKKEVPTQPSIPVKMGSNRPKIELLLCYYLCQLKAVRYGLTLPDQQDPEAIKQAIHTYQFERLNRNQRKRIL